jgi:hypothetical protein
MSILDKYLQQNTKPQTQPNAPPASAPPANPSQEFDAVAASRKTVAEETAAAWGRVAIGTSKEEYRAFSAPTPDRQTRLIIYASKDGYMMPKYDVLYDVFMNPDGSQLALIFAHQVVMIEGRKLLELAGALRTDSVEWIRQFNSNLHAPVLDDRCIITDIRTDVKRSRTGNPFAQNAAGSQ